MTDVALDWSAEDFAADIALDGADLATGSALYTAVVMSLFTWRRALPDDRLPDDVTTRNGWWGDSFSDIDKDRIGSRLWLLWREKITQETINRATEYARESLAWLIEDGIARAVDVETTRNGLHRLDMAITIRRHDGQDRTLRFENVWAEIERAGK